MIAENPRNYATFGIIGAGNKGAGAMVATSPGVANRLWRSLAMGSYTQLSFTEQVKRCTWCGETKLLAEFHRSKSTRDGRKAHCKACGCADTRKWIEANRDEIKERRRERFVADPERYRAVKRAWNNAHRDEIRARDRERTRRNPEQNRQRAHDWYYANRDRARATRNVYYSTHRQEISENARRYRQENKEVIRERKRAAYYRDKPKYAARAEAYLEKNRERTRERVRQYAKSHPERVRFHHYLRRARKSGPLDPETIAFSKMLRRDTCSYCGGPAGTLDHIVPLAKGGAHHWSNLAAACSSCNNRKKTMPALTFLYRSNRRSGG
jgi:5-methylcytosine-specific restriction endonuclease McrA